MTIDEKISKLQSEIDFAETSLKKKIAEVDIFKLASNSGDHVLNLNNELLQSVPMISYPIIKWLRNKFPVLNILYRISKILK
ncbi:MAG: hypothetical protein HKO66_09800 [Saprospiraceae bacterium]|nr:hypothetical protein [Bacteroidia bacterium]NNE14610.1 hypothetical protein [Saprospiraceae bacterium]NNL92513.1 hypothetical protein [Saprospiraceae bacterium]